MVEPSTAHAIEHITNAFVGMCHCQMRNEVTAGTVRLAGGRGPPRKARPLLPRSRPQAHAPMLGRRGLSQ